MSRIPHVPLHPERICWGCDKYCPAADLACGNGTIRTPHPCELFGDDWLEWLDERAAAVDHRLEVEAGS
jgi:hypothetical protein